MLDDWLNYEWLVRYHARTLARPWMPVEELVSVGMFGLWDAARRYDQSSVVWFQVFAAHRVRGEMKDWRERHRPRGGRSMFPHDAEADRGIPMPCRARGITFEGETMTLDQWARRIGVASVELSRRIRLWGKARALGAPAVIHDLFPLR